MITTKKLAAMPYAQAKICYDHSTGDTILVSYNTPVAVVDNDGWLTIRGLFSQTTRRHIGAFMKEICGSTYQTAKNLYENRWTMNIFTGEITEI